MPLERVVQIIVEGLHLEYEDPIEQSHWDSAEGGCTVPTQDTTDLLLDFGLVDLTPFTFDNIANQVIAEHMRCDLGVDGICWRSNKDRDVIVTSCCSRIRP